MQRLGFRTHAGSLHNLFFIFSHFPSLHFRAEPIMPPPNSRFLISILPPRGHVVLRSLAQSKAFILHYIPTHPSLIALSQHSWALASLFCACLDPIASAPWRIILPTPKIHVSRPRSPIRNKRTKPLRHTRPESSRESASYDWEVKRAGRTAILGLRYHWVSSVCTLGQQEAMSLGTPRHRRHIRAAIICRQT